ncbi:MAG: PilZ domain-containing protein [Terracidiphilus sp.]
METRKYCVYNQTRESFLSLGVNVADTAAKQLKVLMENLTIKADAGLWLTPFRGVPATKGLTPVDLIYLDEDNRVIQAIESFPNHAIEPTREQPASALVLAGHTIFSTQTQPGDILLICVADEMEERLARLSNVSGHNAPARGSAEAKSSPVAVAEASSEMDQAAELQIAQQRLAEKDGVEAETVQNASWFIRFLRWLSTDRRGSKRHPLPGLVAYYWTGGAPQAFHIADISTNGLYLLTDERWFPGTMILMTLQRTNTDGDDPDDFISVLTKVIRWGTDGVGLSFVPSNTVDLNSGEALPETGVGKKALHRFIQRVQQPS